MVSRTAKLLGYRLLGDRSRTSCRPRQMGWLVLGLRPAGVRRGELKSECPSRETMARILPKRRCAPLKVLNGVDLHKAS